MMEDKEKQVDALSSPFVLLVSGGADSTVKDTIDYVTMHLQELQLILVIYQH